VEPPVAGAPDHPLKRVRLQPVEPAVHPGRAVGHHHVRSAPKRVQQRPYPFGPNLEVGGQRQDHVAPAPLDAQPKRRRLTERSSEGQQPNGISSGAQGDELGGRGEAAVEDEQELVLLSETVELDREGAVERDQIVRALDDRNDHGDEPRAGGPGFLRTLGGRRHECALGGRDQ
jgi:hypothetical protein